MFKDKCSEWIKLATTNFRIVWAKNLQNPHDRAPLKWVTNQCILSSEIDKENERDWSGIGSGL